jgi:hypothetical protein
MSGIPILVPSTNAASSVSGADGGRMAVAEAGSWQGVDLGGAA